MRALNTMRLLYGALIACLLVIPPLAHAQIPPQDTETIERAVVTSVDKETITATPGTGVRAQQQVLTVEVLTGGEKGKVVTFTNDFTQLRAGEQFYLRHLVRHSEGQEYYTVADPYRLPMLGVLASLFVVLTMLIGGKQGIRGLASLVGSMVLIAYVLLPGVVAGYSPILVSVGVASLIVVVGSYITHGINRTTSTAVLGMIATVLITGLGAWLAVSFGHFSGYTSEDVTYVHYKFNGAIDLVGLLMGGILIGLLGVLYDSAIGQAVAVEELMRAGRHLTKTEVFLRAMRLGREHIGALVNTLAIAYVGATLPLLLLLSTSDNPLLYIINSEGLASELVRIFVGSIGLLLAVPVTTAIAVLVLGTYGVPVRKSSHARHTH